MIEEEFGFLADFNRCSKRLDQRVGFVVVSTACSGCVDSCSREALP